MTSASRAIRIGLALSAAFAATAPLAAVAVERIAGISALAGRSGPSRVSASLEVVPLSARSARLIVTEASGGLRVHDFETEMTQRMHLVVVGENLSSFQHDHPTFDGRGRFALTIAVPAPGAYEVYADTDPRGFGHQVFRFPISFGPPSRTPTRHSLTPTGDDVAAGPYRVALSTLRLVAGRENAIDVSIAKDGAPARDLQPYLGGAAHAVFIDARTLDYLHVHPMPARQGRVAMAMTGDSMPSLAPNASVPAHMSLHVEAPARGSYKLWLQFRGGGKLRVAPFVVTAR